MLLFAVLCLSARPVLCSTGGEETPDPSDDQVIFDSVEVLSRAKSQAESRIRMARALVADNELEKADLRMVQALYDEARADVNAGLDRLLVELAATGDYESAEPFTRIAERAEAHVSTFITESDQVILGEDRGLAEAGIGVAGDIAQALVDVWKTLRGENTGRHDKLVTRIDALKWSKYDDV